MRRPACTDFDDNSAQYAHAPLGSLVAFPAREARGAMESDLLQPPGRRGAGGRRRHFLLSGFRLGGAPRGTGGGGGRVESLQ